MFLVLLVFKSDIIQFKNSPDSVSVKEKLKVVRFLIKENEFIFELSEVISSVTIRGKIREF